MTVPADPAGTVAVMEVEEWTVYVATEVVPNLTVDIRSEPGAADG